MTHLPTRRDVQWSIDARQRHDSGAANTKADLFLVFAMCAIGLLTTLDVMLRFPDLGALIASYNQF
jgi:hypothetical protein